MKIQHRAWANNVIAILNEEKHQKNSNKHECGLGKWLEQDAKKYLESDYEEVQLQHENIHLFAENLLKLHQEGHKAEVLKKMDEFYSLSARMLAFLK